MREIGIFVAPRRELLDRIACLEAALEQAAERLEAGQRGSDAFYQASAARCRNVIAGGRWEDPISTEAEDAARNGA